MVEMKDSVLPRFREVVAVLAHRAALGRDRRAHRPAARRRRGRRRLDVLRRGEGRRARRSEQFGKGSIDGLMAAETGDMSSIPGHIIPCARARHPGLGAVGGADGGDDHPRHPARADADDRAPALHLRRGGDDVAGDHHAS